MNAVVKIGLDLLKIFVVFVVCTILFYYVLRAFHNEYEKLDRYESPQGNAVKVMSQEETDMWKRLSIFFRLGE